MANKYKIIALVESTDILGMYNYIIEVKINDKPIKITFRVSEEFKLFKIDKKGIKLENWIDEQVIIHSKKLQELDNLSENYVIDYRL